MHVHNTVSHKLSVTMRSASRLGGASDREVALRTAPDLESKLGCASALAVQVAYCSEPGERNLFCP